MLGAEPTLLDPGEVNIPAVGRSLFNPLDSLFFPYLLFCPVLLESSVCRPAQFQRISDSPALSNQRCGKPERLRLSRASASRLQSSVMALFRRDDSEQLMRATSDLSARVQRLEEELAKLRAQVEGDRQLRNMGAQISAAAQAAPLIGAAIERFAEAMRSPLPPRPRGRSGALARAKSAWDVHA